MKAHLEEQLNIQALIFPTLLPSLSSYAGTGCTYNPVAEINAAPAFTQIGDEVPLTNTSAAALGRQRNGLFRGFLFSSSVCMLHNM